MKIALCLLVVVVMIRMDMFCRAKKSFEDVWITGYGPSEHTISLCSNVDGLWYCKERITIRKALNYETGPLRWKSKTTDIACLSTQVDENSRHIGNESLYAYVSSKVMIVHTGQTLNKYIGFLKDCERKLIFTVPTLVTSHRTELMQQLQKLESVDTVPILVVHTKRSYIPVNLSGKSVAITQVIIVNQTKSFRFEYVKTLIKCVLLLAFFLKIKTPSDNESSKQDKTNEIIACTFLNHSFELKGLTKHLYQCYISPNVEDTVCCPTLQHTSEVSNNNTKHGIIKRGHEDSESDSGEDSRSTSPLGDTISQKAANAAQLPANVNMVGEWDRYITYGKCPDDSHCKNVYPTILAKNGFYFNVEKDLSECFSCGGRVNVWEEETVVKDVHLKIFSQCDFANGKDTFNVPIHNDEKGNDTIYTELASGACGVNENVNIEPKCETVSTEHKSSKITHRHEKQRTETPLEQLSYAEDTLFASARHPDLASRENRTSTFLNWAYSHTASINSLVDAGLYYTGTVDEVRCFQCGGGMRNWQQGDDPWMEHAYWFPDCEYVRQRRGQGFIDMVRMGRAFERGLDIGPSQRTLQPTEQERYTESQLFSQHRANPWAPPSDIATVQIPDDLMLDSVANMGFDKEHVILALGHIRRTHSEGYKIQPEELIDYLLANPRTEPSVVTPWVSKEINEEARPKKERKNKKKSNDVNNALDTSSENKDISAILDENEKLKQQFMCKVCMDNNACVVFVPCGHMITCVKCASALRKCAICRANIQGSIRAYLG